jgi:hypothetical protein
MQESHLTQDTLTKEQKIKAIQLEIAEIDFNNTESKAQFDALVARLDILLFGEQQSQKSLKYYREITKNKV